MLANSDKSPYEFTEEIHMLFYRRTIICLWLGIIFFSLFAILDYICCQEFIALFLQYRAMVVIALIASLLLLRLKSIQRMTPLLMYLILLWGTLSIALMTVKLGGFSSGYYVGILLIIVGAFSVLPLLASQAVFFGLSMYLVYLATVFIGTGFNALELSAHGVNNSFFFLALIGGTAVQCMDDIQLQLNSLRVQRSLRAINEDLVTYTDNLEQLVQERMAQQEETDLKFRDLYNNLLDLAILIDRQGIIKMVNQHSITLLGKAAEELEGTHLLDYIQVGDLDSDPVEEIISIIDSNHDLDGMQLQMAGKGGEQVDVELTGNRVIMEDSIFFQLILRDISVTKKMERQILESEQLIDTSRQAAIFGLAKLAECRDDDTGAHLERIRLYTRILTLELRNQPELRRIITNEFLEDIYRTSVLHDIGKVGIPDSILLKPGKLTENEYSVMKNHCIFGSNTLEEAETRRYNQSFLRMGRDIAHFHHERWNGQGYPEGLAGNAIPLAARIVALADVYDALTTARVYKPAYDHEETKRIILQQRGQQFDPCIVDAFIKKEEEFKKSSVEILLHS